MSKRFLGIICILYSLMFSYVVFLGKLKNFLAPQMHIYIKLSILPFLYIGLVLIFNKKVTYKFKISDLVLLLPLVMLFFAGDGRLTSSFASNRSLSVKSEKRVKVEKEEKKEEVKTTTTTKKVKEEVKEEFVPDILIVDSNYNELSGNITFDTENYKERFVGKKIRVKGFVMKKASFLTKDYFALGKYGVSCCVADAEFTGFVIKYDINKVEENKWYEVDGVIEPGIDAEGYEILYIRVVNIKEIDSKNEEMYAYACYTYDNGECKEVQKYLNN